MYVHYLFIYSWSYAAPRAAYLDWIVGLGYTLSGTFWVVLNISVCASGTQLGLYKLRVMVTVKVKVTVTVTVMETATVTVTVTDLYGLKHMTLVTQGPNWPLQLKNRDVTDEGSQLTSTVTKAWHHWGRIPTDLLDLKIINIHINIYTGCPKKMY